MRKLDNFIPAERHVNLEEPLVIVEAKCEVFALNSILE